MSSSGTKRRGLGLIGVVTIVLVVLKLANVQPVSSWSWVWVLSPLWIDFLLAFGIILIGLAAAGNRSSSSSSRPRRGSEREMYAKMAERAQRDQFRKPSNMHYFDQRNGVR